MLLSSRNTPDWIDQLPVKFDDCPSTTVPLHISRVNHQTLVTIDEEGGTAAAIAGSKDKDKGPPPPKWIEFRADRPFLFLIRHARTKSILFMGRVVDPTA